MNRNQLINAGGLNAGAEAGRGKLTALPVVATARQLTCSRPEFRPVAETYLQRACVVFLDLGVEKGSRPSWGLDVKQKSERAPMNRLSLLKSGQFLARGLPCPTCLSAHAEPPQTLSLPCPTRPLPPRVLCTEPRRPCPSRGPACSCLHAPKYPGQRDPATSRPAGRQSRRRERKGAR